MRESSTPEYRCWSGMKQRCGNKNGKSWATYGGRGIRVCERWMTYANFLADMGRRPAGTTSIDRIDNSKGYSPDNCRWATAAVQNRNRRINKLTTEQVVEVKARYAAGGVTQTSLAAAYGVSVAVINHVVTGKCWTDIGSRADKLSTRIGAAKLTGNEVREMRGLYAAGGISMGAVARKFGISKSAVFGIIRGRRWPE